jgi:rod shape-determining protein MreD
VRWPVFALFAYLFLVLEVSLRNVLMLGPIGPSFVIVLVVFISLFAPRFTALWACWVLGMLVDLCTPLMHGADRVGPLLGAHALGYVFGGYVILQIRAMLFRRRAVTMAVMTVICFVAASLVVVFLYAIHGFYPGEAPAWAEMRPVRELLLRLGVAGYSGLLALLIGPMLMWSAPLWAFRAGPQPYAGRR